MSTFEVKSSYSSVAYNKKQCSVIAMISDKDFLIKYIIRLFYVFRTKR